MRKKMHRMFDLEQFFLSKIELQNSGRDPVEVPLNQGIDFRRTATRARGRCRDGQWLGAGPAAA